MIWKPVVAPTQLIEFEETTGCYSQDCSAGDSPWWKPVLFRNDASVDVLMYGPGAFDEVEFTGLDGALSSSVPGSLGSSIDVPVLMDRFFDDTDRSVWWIRPNYPNDLLWRDLGGTVTQTSDFNDRSFTDEHYTAVQGKFAFGHNAILWTSPTSVVAYVIYAAAGQLQQFAVDKAQCGLESGIHYNVIPGDYDGDSTDELAWYDFDSETVTVWPLVTACEEPPSFPVGKAKLSAIRISGQRDSLMAYRPQDGTVRFYDATTGVPSTPLAVGVDASPVLRDFDGDGCTDILWFAPHASSSLLWRSRCNDTATFVMTAVEHPDSAYPLGFGLGHGRL